MSIAALSLLPRLQTVWASGSPISNLGLIMICSAQTVTKLDLSKYVFGTLQLSPPPPPPPPPTCIQHSLVPNNMFCRQACCLHVVMAAAGLLVVHGTIVDPFKLVQQSGTAAAAAAIFA